MFDPWTFGSNRLFLHKLLQFQIDLKICFIKQWPTFKNVKRACSLSPFTSTFSNNGKFGTNPLPGRTYLWRQGEICFIKGLSIRETNRDFRESRPEKWLQISLQKRAFRFKIYDTCSNLKGMMDEKDKLIAHCLMLRLLREEQ